MRGQGQAHGRTPVSPITKSIVPVKLWPVEKVVAGCGGAGFVECTEIGACLLF